MNILDFLILFRILYRVKVPYKLKPLASTITQIMNTKGSHPLLPFIWESREGAKKITLSVSHLVRKSLSIYLFRPLKIQIHQCSKKSLTRELWVIEYLDLEI